MKSVSLIFFCSLLMLSCNQPKDETSALATDAKPPQAEFADPKYVDIGKQALEQLAKGNVDDFGSALSDNVVWYWNNGDSVATKDKLVEYWKDRRGNVIDTITYVNDIWFAIKVNESQKGPDSPGVWLLGWADTSVTYKNGKSIRMWIHTDYHFDSNDKIDVVTQYVDRAVINAALSAK